MRPAFLAALGMNFAGPMLHDSPLAGSPGKIANGFSMDWDPMKVKVRLAAANVPFLPGSRGNTIALLGPNGFAVMIYQNLTGQRLNWHPGPMIPENR